MHDCFTKVLEEIKEDKKQVDDVTDDVEEKDEPVRIYFGWVFY